MNIEEGKFYKLISRDYHGFVLSSRDEEAVIMAKRMTNEGDVNVSVITDENEIKQCLTQIKTTTTFH